MRQNSPNDLVREYIQESLTEFAAFFVQLVEGSEDQIHESVTALKLIDEKAKQTLSDQMLREFSTRKTSLMGLFRDRLFTELRGQVQDDVLIRAKEVVTKLEQGEPIN